jgi:hypothetical protein
VETKDIIGKVVELKPEFLIKLFGIERVKKIKEARPYLILELLYKGEPRLFAIPFQTSIKHSLADDFWEKLPARLETKSGMKRGMIFSSMLPIIPEAVLKIKETERSISKLQETQEVLFENIIKNDIIRRNEDLIEKAKTSFEYLRKQIYKKGLSCFQDESVNKAYTIISKEIHYKTYKIINDGLSPNESGKRPLIEKAQNYLDNFYLKTLENKQNKGIYRFIDMPKHYTDIERLIDILDKNESRIQQSEPSIKEFKFEETTPIRCYPYSSGKHIENDKILIKLPVADQSKPILVKQPIELPAAHVRIRTDSSGVFVVAATTNLISQVAALKKNIHIPIKTK